MALTAKHLFSDSMLKLLNPEQGMYTINHIFEPEYHQDIYVKACDDTKNATGSFQVGDIQYLVRPINRGTQPSYADDENDPETLCYEGMISCDGTRLIDENQTLNVCALKSNCIRNGYIDTSLARSVGRTFYKKVESRAAVQKNDILINSTGDGTIGRVAVYNYDFPAVVDGHITIVRYKNPKLAWYVAAFLMTETGQNQIYRYINGSSGQVEIYPQDIARIWVKPASSEVIEEVYKNYKNACDKHDEFYRDLTAALHKI